ncbi:biotin/lipoyl-containing protein, partial [Streptomyces sp. NPDC048606]|uniref:biotin/lipoyl-containing protein n=1 Tax=Streptomyces sp. NPDC048606 TaxID=3154726 RepID=UPI00343FF23E
RALAEFEIEGMATAIPFHRAVVTDPAFAPTDGTPFTVHTRWIETEFVNDLKAFSAPAAEDTEDEDSGRESLIVEVGGRRLEVTLPSSLGALSKGAQAVSGTVTKAKRRNKKNVKLVSGDTLASPMQGTIVKVAVEEGQQVEEGDLIVVLEAMKMEQPLNAHRSGTIVGLSAEVGASLTSGATICEIKA